MPKTTTTANDFLFAAQLSEVGGGEKRKRRFEGVAYSGGVLNHAWIGRVAFDLSSTRAATDITPVLVDHDAGQRAGFGVLGVAADKLTVSGTLLDNVHGRAVAQESDEGFPWQMSVRIESGSVEYLEAGVESTVNGNPITGPAQIWRQNLIREVSFTATGVDHETRALAASHQSGPQPPQPHEDQAMTATVEQLSAQVTALQASLAAAEQRATDAESAIAEYRRARRVDDVKGLFQAMQRDYTEEAAKPYLGMSDEAFSVVSADLRALYAKPSAPEGLFSAMAVAGAPAAPDDALVDQMAKL